MTGQTIRINSRAGGGFDCYLGLPDTSDKVPAIVLASAVHGVDRDIRDIADEFVAHGYIAAAPDLFSRSIPGPLARDDGRAAQRSQPRLQKIAAGEADMADTLAEVRQLAQFNGRAAVIGFCYGGPYAILGPKRLGYDAGISCHGTQMGDFVHELDGVAAPVCVIWGEEDFAAPAPVREAYGAAAARIANLDLHVFPGVLHGYMFPGNAKAFSAATRQLSMARALAILAALKEAPLRRAS